MTEAIKIVAVDRFASAPGVAQVRTALNANVPPNWKYIKFGTASKPDETIEDLLNQLAELNAAAIDTLEIVAEGTPASIASLDLDILPMDVVAFGTGLQQNVPGVSQTTKVYLSGCNTGLAEKNSSGAADRDIAQQVANSSRTVVFGAIGYLSGAHALRNEEATTDFSASAGVVAGGVRGVREGTVNGKDCWRMCTAKDTHPTALAKIHAPAAPRTRIMAPLTPQQVETIRADVRGKPFADPPTYRVGPERVIRIPVSDTETRTLHVIARGTFLRDAKTYDMWQNTQREELLRWIETDSPREQA